MARARDPNRDKAFEIWKQSNGEIKLKDIADQLGISEGTVRGWKNKDKWDSGTNGTFQSKGRNGAKSGSERSKGTERSTRIEERNVSPPEIENDDGPLTEKQRLFVLEYLRDFNATRAAMAIGYSKKTAYAIGWNLLRKVEIQAEIKRQKELRATELGLDVQRVIAEYMKIAFADITDLLEFGQKKEQILDEQGNPVLDPITGEPMTYKRNYVSFKNSDEIDGTVVGEVKQGKDGVSIKLHDKMKALEKLEKYVGFMTEEQRLKLEKTKLEVAHLRGEDEQQEDDGFLDALDGKVEQIWDDEDE